MAPAGITSQARSIAVPLKSPLSVTTPSVSSTDKVEVKSRDTPNTPKIEATRIIAEWVASVTPDVLTSELRAKLKEVIIDYIGVTIGGAAIAPSTESLVNGVRTLQEATGKGRCTVITKGQTFTPAQAGLLNGAFGHSLDFDDTHGGATLHPGTTAIPAALTQAEICGDSVDMDKVLLAVAVAYEITCRIGRELGTDAYNRGFHNTSVAGIFGAVAAICVLKDVSADVVETAFGLAGSKAAGSCQFLENGSWNKRLHAGFAVHDAFLCVALAEAGIVGSTRALEGQFGLLHAYSPKEDNSVERLVAGLGSQWYWTETALKPFPACRMTHVFIEMAGEMGKHAGNNKEVKKMTLTLPTNNIQIVGQATPNKVNPKSMVDAQFSAYYQTANAWLHGSNTGVKTYDLIGDEEINALCRKLECLPSADFTVCAGSIQITYEDGSQEQRFQQYPLGELQHPFTREKVDAKFLGLVEPSFGTERANTILKTIDGFEHHHISDLMNLLQ